jgi:hypothetical protein
MTIPTWEPAAGADPQHDEAAARARALATSLDATLTHLARGRELEADARFQALVALVAAAFDARQREGMVSDESAALRCAAIVAMAQVGDRSHREVARRLDRIGYFALDFAIEFLGECADPDVFGLVLLRLPGYVGDWRELRGKFFGYLRRMEAAAATPALSDAHARLDWTLEGRRDALPDYDVRPVMDFVEALRPVEMQRRALDDDQPVASTPTIRRRQDELHALLDAPGRPCVLVVGDAGTGRRTLARSVLQERMDEGWMVVEASPRALLADLQHLESAAERVQAMGEAMSGDRMLWHVTDWFELLEEPDSNSATTVLEHLWPQIEAGALQLVATSSPHNHRRAYEDLPSFDHVFRTLEIERMEAPDALALAREWARRQSARVGLPVIDEPTLAAAFALADRCLPGRSEPGRTLATLQDALRESVADPTRPAPISHDAIVRALARRSGWPPAPAASSEGSDRETTG